MVKLSDQLSHPLKKGQEATLRKLARFSSERKTIGDISRNSPFGIFGTLTEKLENHVADKPLPVALSNEVKEGPAEILTVVDHDKVEI